MLNHKIDGWTNRADRNEDGKEELIFADLSISFPSNKSLLPFFRYKKFWFNAKKRKLSKKENHF